MKYAFIWTLNFGAYAEDYEENKKDIRGAGGELESELETARTLKLKTQMA